MAETEFISELLMKFRKEVFILVWTDYTYYKIFYDITEKSFTKDYSICSMETHIYPMQ